MSLPNFSTSDLASMDAAIEVAKLAINSGDVPVGAIVFDSDGFPIGRGRNRRELENDSTAHAEIVAIREAAAHLGTWRLDGCSLFVTLEPCAMCAGAIAQSRLSRLVFGAWDEKAGAVGSVWDVLRDPRSPLRIEVVSGVKEAECAALLTGFFQQFRD